MGYKVLIPTAGIGSRLGNATKYLNKSMVSIANKPTLARIIDMFPSDAKFVIPTGYKAETVKEFIALAYPERDITLIDVYPYEGEGSGLGYTILCCEKYLQEPFVFCSCDTLVKEKMPNLDQNWMGYGIRENCQQYRTLDVEEGKVTYINEKQHAKDNSYPYIGLAGIKDYELFWKKMHEDRECAVAQGESFGLRGLLAKGIEGKKFSWMDTGIPEELEETRKYFSKPDDPNILEKADESIWFMDNSVIKFSNNTKFISDRVKRAAYLEGFIPSITDFTEHMYKYEHVDGEVMSKCVNLPIFEKMLIVAKEFWKEKQLSDGERERFKTDCMKFYKNKTYERIELFYTNFGKEDREYEINGIKMPMLKKMLDTLDWNWVAEGIPVCFHGDFHFENVLYDKTKDGFIFLDWRQSFGSSIEIGDVYYDLGKLLHGMIVCHELIARDEYHIDWQGNKIEFDLRRKQMLVDCEQYYYKWIDNQGYDVKKVKLMAALIYLNIAALHHYPYGLMLYALGKQILWSVIH